MSNLCTLHPEDRKKIVDVKTLNMYVHRAYDEAIVGTMEGQDGGYDESFEAEATEGVDAEVDTFRSDLIAGGKRAKYWIESLQKELPFLFQEAV